MSRKPRVQRTPEEKWQIVLEGLKSGNVAETCRLATLKCHGFWATTLCEPRWVASATLDTRRSGPCRRNRASPNRNDRIDPCPRH